MRKLEGAEDAARRQRQIRRRQRVLKKQPPPGKQRRLVLCAEVSRGSRSEPAAAAIASGLGADGEGDSSAADWMFDYSGIQVSEPPVTCGAVR